MLSHKCFCTHLLLQKCLCTGISFVERRLVHTDSGASKHRRLCTEVSTHIYTHDLTQKALYTQKVSTHRSSHFRTASFDARKALTHNSIYTQNLREAFTCRLFYKRKIYTLVPLRTDAFTYRSSYTLTPSHTDVFACRSLFTQVHLSTDAFPDGRIHTRFFKRHQATTHRRFYTQNPLEREAVTPKLRYTCRFFFQTNAFTEETLSGKSVYTENLF